MPAMHSTCATYVFTRAPAPLFSLSLSLSLSLRSHCPVLVDVQEGYELDEGVVNNAVKACCRAGRPSEAEAVLAKSLERGLVPEVCVCGGVCMLVFCSLTSPTVL